ncbi:MAG: ATP-binding protein, partial [Acidimicrobiia bacterium]|nr:ATP-binding protein [Acidimicrobiia bacterium]
MSDGFFLGGAVDSAGERTDDNVQYDSSDLTTHGVIVGMTGSGKTGLGVIFLEEALLEGIPTLVIDPKGDMTNLLLTFPDLLPADFEPWVDEAEARKDGKTVEEAAAATSELWKGGLESWGIAGDRIRELRDRAGFTIYTPGSEAGVPVNIVGSLRKPDGDFDANAEALRDEIQGFVSGLLGLTGIDADPISSREHILLSNIIEHAWRQGHDLDLASLLGFVQQPPMRKLGVFEVDTFFPEKDRTALAMKLNGLVASPAFQTWLAGPPLDVGKMLWDEDGKPQASILYLAHLSETERQFIVTLILSKVVTWMRSQQGSGNLRAMVYMDEVFGFVPPTASPPAKTPILTLLKQARAFGVGLLLSTQNPVDLDYKAMSNAGTWCVGRLQTERDKARILEALKSARGDSDVKALDAAISGLGKRQFLLHSTREAEPTIFGTRWAMSYLRGPLTREQIGSLMGDVAPVPPREPSQTPPERPSPRPDVDDDVTPVMPKIAAGVPVRWMTASAPWAEKVSASPGSTRYRAGIAARVDLLYDDTRAGVKHDEEWETVLTPLGATVDIDDHLDVDYDTRDLTETPPGNATYEFPEAPIDKKSFFTEVERDLKEYLYRNRTVAVMKNPSLKLYSRVGESPEDFLARCDEAAQEGADAQVSKLRDKYRTKVDRAQDQLAAAERRVAELEVDVQGSRQREMLDGAGALIGILTGRRRTRSITGSARSRSSTRSKEQRLRTAQAKVDDKVIAIDDLESELRDELIEI